MRENTAYLYGQLTRDPICYKNPSTQELLSGQITIKTARRTNATGELFVKGRLRIDFITRRYCLGKGFFIYAGNGKEIYL